VLACSRISYRTDSGRVVVSARELEVIGHTALRRQGARNNELKGKCGSGERVQTTSWRSECGSQRTDRHIGPSAMSKIKNAQTSRVVASRGVLNIIANSAY
jgi:hypothetical protein